MLRAFRLPIGWKELLTRTVYFFLALFPALLFVVALVSFLPVEGLLEGITSTLARVAPGDAITIVRDQILKIANDDNSGLLTLRDELCHV